MDEPQEVELLIKLRSGVMLTPEEARIALDEAMRIIECVGTTGIEHKHRDADKWLIAYYPTCRD